MAAKHHLTSSQSSVPLLLPVFCTSSTKPHMSEASSAVEYGTTSWTTSGAPEMTASERSVSPDGSGYAASG